MNITQNIPILLIVIAFIILSILFYFLRVKKNFEIKTSELTLAFVLLFLILLPTGIIKEVDFLGIKATLRNTVDQKINIDEFEKIETEKLIEVDKGGVSVIDTIIPYNPEALVFEMKHEYFPEVINAYINQIPSLEFLLIKTETKEFVGLMEISNYRKMNKGEEFTRAISYDNPDDFNALKPYLITNDKALTTNKTRKDALDYFSKNETMMILPVIEEDTKRFIGILRREVLTSRLLQTIFEEIE